MVSTDNQELADHKMSLSDRPIIILGAARSGTKFLRDTLAASRSTAATPYDLNFVWRTNNESFPSDALPADLCHASTQRLVAAGLRRAAGIGADDSRRLLEKTVSNTLRVGFVARVFPNADFVHIVRDGRDVTASALAKWSMPVNLSYLIKKLRSFPLRNYRYALWYLGNRLRPRSTGRAKAIWGPLYPGIEADVSTLPVPVVCAKQWRNSVESVQRSQADEGGIRLKEIRYEDLVNSETAIAELVQWLNLPDEQAILDRYRRTVRAGKGRSWEDVIPAENSEQVLAEIEPLLHSLGYL